MLMASPKRKSVGSIPTMCASGYGGIGIRVRLRSAILRVRLLLPVPGSVAKLVNAVVLNTTPAMVLGSIPSVPTIYNSEVARAWIGSLIQAEGHISHKDIEVGSNDIEVMSALLRLTECGSVGLKTRAGEHTYTKDYYRWRCRKDEASAIIGEVARYLTGL